MNNTDPLPTRLLGKPFGLSELAVIEEQIREANPNNRNEIARRVCKSLGWYGPGGKAQEMSARVALLRLHRNGLITLPPPQNSNANGKKAVTQFTLDLKQAPVVARVDQLESLNMSIIEKKTDSRLYNELIERYHYLGYTPMAGAQIRYLIKDGSELLGVIGFGASAWKVACRDKYIGWSRERRHANLHWIVNNWRFLILPWVRCQNLASKILSLCARRLPEDFNQRYGYSPVMLETFVQVDRYSGHCYRTANWQYLGQTQGRGKKGQLSDPRVAIKSVWVYPLRSNFRDVLCGDEVS